MSSYDFGRENPVALRAKVMLSLIVHRTKNRFKWDITQKTPFGGNVKNYFRAMEGSVAILQIRLLPGGWNFSVLSGTLGNR